MEPTIPVSLSNESKEDGMLDSSSQRRRLSIPEAFTQSSSPPDWVPSKAHNKDKESPEKPPVPYEFEKLRDDPLDTLEDRAARDAFRPQRQYMSHQRPEPKAKHQPAKRRSSLELNKAVLKERRGSLTEQLKQARKSFHSSMPTNLDFQLSQQETDDADKDAHLTAFERKRKKQQMEEGALYAATRATERATRSWKRKTIVLGPLGLIPDEEDESKEEAEEKRALLTLLEKDATKHNASLSSIIHEQNNDNEDVGGDETKGKDNKNNNTTDKEAVKERKLREVFEKQTSATTDNNDKSPKDAKPEEVSADTDDHMSARKEQLRLLKIALKKAAKSKEPALMSLVLLENAKQLKKTKRNKNKRGSMPDMSLPDNFKISSKETTNNNGGKKKKKRLSDPSLDEAAAMDNSSKSATATTSSPKKNRRSYMLRRMSAPDFSSTVAALTSHGKNPEEALKEMATMPKHMLADIITAPLEIPRDSNSSSKEGEKADATNGKKKKKKGSRRASAMSASMSQLEGQLSSRRRDSVEDAGADTSNDNDKATKTRRSSRRSVMKESRRSSLPDLTKMPEEGVVYDWALAAKQKENNGNDGDGEWKHIKSNANAVRRPQEETMQPLKLNDAIASVSDSLPKLEALLPLVEPQK